MLEAAQAVFLERGYADANLDEIVARAGGSKRNVYTWFGGKEGLFEAVLHRLLESMLEATLPPIDPCADPRAWLLEIGRSIQHHILHAHHTSSLRRLIAAAETRPELARRAYQRGPGALLEHVEEFLVAQTVAGAWAIERPRLAARAFVSLIRADRQIEWLLTGQTPEHLNEDDYVVWVVEHFLASF
ncbi:MAG: TetR/AcrR family transcriptional regulator [Myxococcota bacterium]